MAYVNLLETDLVLEFATLLGEFDQSRAAELKAIAESKTSYVDVIEKGFAPVFSKIIEAKKRNTIDAATVMSFAVASKIEGEDRDKAVIMIHDAIIANEKEIDQMHLLSMLTNLFNVLDKYCRARFTVFMSIAKRAKAANAHHWLVSKHTINQLENFKTQWALSDSDYSELLLIILRLLRDTDKKRDFGDILLKFLQSLDEKTTLGSIDGAKEWTTEAILATFKSPFELADRMRTLLGLEAVRELKSSEGPLLELLDIYVEEDFKRYLAFAEKKENQEYMKKRNIVHEENVNHFRVFAACKLPLGEYKYDAIRKALEVDGEDDIENAIVGLVLSKKVDAKIDQAQGLIHIRHTVQREFQDAQWPELGQQLRKWKEGVSNVLSSLPGRKHVRR